MAFAEFINKIKYNKIINNMFLIPKSNFKKFDPERSCFVLNEFAAAEFSSAVEMLFAAKTVDNKKLSDGVVVVMNHEMWNKVRKQYIYIYIYIYVCICMCVRIYDSL